MFVVLIVYRVYSNLVLAVALALGVLTLTVARTRSVRTRAGDTECRLSSSVVMLVMKGEVTESFDRKVQLFLVRVVKTTAFGVVRLRQEL